MPEFIMEFDVDETGKLINARRKEEIVRCRDCTFHRTSNEQLSWCDDDPTKPDGYCNLGIRIGAGKQQQQRCDTCKYEKSRWFTKCADCSDFDLWESK